MKKIVFAFLSMVSMLAVQAQSGAKDAQTRQVSGFHGVDVSGGIDLYLSYGPESVAISASTEVRDHIVTEVVGGILRIHLEDNWWSHDRDGGKMKADVSLKNLKSLEGRGGGYIIFENLIKMRDLDLQLSLAGVRKGKPNY